MFDAKKQENFETRWMDFMEANEGEEELTPKEEAFLELLERDRKKEFVDKVIVAIVLFFIVVFVLFAGIVKYRVDKNVYEDAIFLYNEGELIDSLELFYEVKDFRNAEFYITIIASKIASGELESEQKGENGYVGREN